MILGQPQLLSPLMFVNKSASSATIVWQAWNNKTDFGDGPVDLYILYCDISGSMELCRNVSIQSNIEQYVEVFVGLNHHTNYSFSMVVVRPGPGGEGPLGAEYQHLTACIGNYSY